MSQSKLYVGNMSFDTSETELREAFAAFGQVESVHVVTDRDTGRLKYCQQFCLVMLCHEFANDGIENIVVAHPISISFEAWIVDQIFAPDCLE